MIEHHWKRKYRLPGIEEPIDYATLCMVVRDDPEFGFLDPDTGERESIAEAGSHSDAELWSDVIMPAIEARRIKVAPLTPTLTDARARFVASLWYGGMYTALYALCSTGSTILYADEDLRRIRSELQECVSYATGERRHEVTDIDREQLRRLVNYVENAGIRGPVDGWGHVEHWDETPPTLEPQWVDGATLRHAVREAMWDHAHDPWGSAMSVLGSITDALHVSGEEWTWEASFGVSYTELSPEEDGLAIALIEGICEGHWTMRDLQRWGRIISRYLHLADAAGKSWG